LNLLYAFAMTFTVANLYYNQPILTVLADDFKVTHERVSLIPTLTQAGYAFGLVLICPLGDMFRRRPLVLLLVFVTATLWIGLLITKNFTAFVVLTFLVSVLGVTPQLMMPLVAEWVSPLPSLLHRPPLLLSSISNPRYAPQARRGQSLAICFSGVGLGILLARLLSGVISSSSPWRNIYRIALALQYLIVALLYLFMPDYPSANPTGLAYLRVLASIPPLPFRHPVLAQAVVATFLTSAVMLNFWTTLTFLLSSPLYSYSTLQIGLFALIGIAAMLTTPLLGRYLVDAYVPLFAAILVSPKWPIRPCGQTRGRYK
jgi:MFS family permease